MNNQITWITDTLKRACGECTACCEGWLPGEAYSHKFFPGKQCFFLKNTGCTIYDKRPDFPCKKFECRWLKDNQFPEWMKPSLCKAIITFDKVNSFEFVRVTEAGQKLDSEVLSFMFQYALTNHCNLAYQIDQKWHYIGDTSFLRAMTNQNQIT